MLSQYQSQHKTAYIYLKIANISDNIVAVISYRQLYTVNFIMKFLWQNLLGYLGHICCYLQGTNICDILCWYICCDIWKIFAVIRRARGRQERAKLMMVDSAGSFQGFMLRIRSKDQDILQPKLLDIFCACLCKPVDESSNWTLLSELQNITDYPDISM